MSNNDVFEPLSSRISETFLEQLIREDQMLVAGKPACWSVLKSAVLMLAVTVMASPMLLGQVAQTNQQQYTPQQQAAAAAQQQAAQQLAAQRQAAAQPPQRAFAELNERDRQYRDSILDYWQQSSNQVKRYECDFRRYEYDTEFVNYRDPETQQLAAAMVGIGKIRFAEPDRARYDTTELWKFVKPGEGGYKQVEGTDAQERWITDGKFIYEFDFEAKRLYEVEIPGEMRGPQGLDKSPIPFLFGANKQLILNRYWVRVITPPAAAEKGEYWLEAFPKRAEDGQNYSRIEIILDSTTCMPKGMHMYSPQYNPKKNNFASRYFEFENRKVNSQLSGLQNFFGNFVRPQLPIGQGWKRVPRMAGAGNSPNGQAATEAGTIRK